MFIAAAFFYAEGAFGIALLASGQPFWSASGPVIVQGLGCALACTYWIASEFHDRRRRRHRGVRSGDAARYVQSRATELAEAHFASRGRSR